VLKNVGDFRLLDRKCIEALKQMRESERYTKGLFCWIGYKKKEILFDHGDREYGKSHWNFMQLAGLAIEGLTSFTVSPLRWATYLGFIIGVGALFYLLWTLIKVALWGDPVAGFPTLICVILFLGASQLIAIGILGEYLGKIFNESKRRPVYLVEEYHDAFAKQERIKNRF
jgi:glycosyltransferase involved in cell wall biosynthesis